MYTVQEIESQNSSVVQKRVKDVFIIFSGHVIAVTAHKTTKVYHKLYSFDKYKCTMLFDEGA